MTVCLDMHPELEEMWFQWLPHSRLVLRALQVSDLEHFLKRFLHEGIDDFVLPLLTSDHLEELHMSAPERIRFLAAVAATIAAHGLPANNPDHPGPLPPYSHAYFIFVTNFGANSGIVMAGVNIFGAPP